MAISLVDTAVPMNDTGYPVARAKHIWFDDNATLQDKLNNKELGGDDSTVLTQQEYEALSEEQKLDGLYYTYDTKRIYKNGVQYGASDAEGIGYNNAESGIQATTVQGAIDKVVKTVEDAYAKKTDIKTMTYVVLFGDVTWQKSSLGKFYNVIELPNVSKILSVSLGDFYSITPDEIIQPFITSDKQVGIMSNTAKSNGRIIIYITYI